MLLFIIILGFNIASRLYIQAGSKLSIIILIWWRTTCDLFFRFTLSFIIDKRSCAYTIAFACFPIKIFTFFAVMLALTSYFVIKRVFGTCPARISNGVINWFRRRTNPWSILESAILEKLIENFQFPANFALHSLSVEVREFLWTSDFHTYLLFSTPNRIGRAILTLVGVHIPYRTVSRTLETNLVF